MTTQCKARWRADEVTTFGCLREAGHAGQHEVPGVMRWGRESETSRNRIDELLDQQRWIGIHMDRSTTKGFDLINARQRWHKLDAEISRLCRESGERRMP